MQTPSNDSDQIMPASPLRDVRSLKTVQTPAQILRHLRHLGMDLEADPERPDFDDSGLDFRTLRARDPSGHPWILRVPRRPEVFRASWTEARALRLLSGEIPVEVPCWKVHDPAVIAYPMLPGDPAWTLGEEGLRWSIDPEAPPPAFLPSLTHFLATLRRIPGERLHAAEIPVRTLSEIRDERRQMIEQTREVLEAPPMMESRWKRWLDNEEVWPDRAVVVHGDLHPGHLLLDPDGAVRGVLDWTEIHVGDPATDLVFVAGTLGRGALEEVIRGMDAIGANLEPHLASHVLEAWAFNPVPMAAWGLVHDHRGVIESARAQLAQIQTG